ncbi:15882_t:CDS:2 [Racocetra persica]|uniref:15882_t:CDS:1 n=1 Tax=Racocetra persica TaxID=160502 RepID=A0ACA9KTA2_9GLOM|nr:15882_t:CDS:2 [Racocetra persica]
MSDFTLKEDWFHSDLLKIFALNILKNSQEMCPKCLVQPEIRVDEIEIIRKHTAQSLFESSTSFTTDLNELNNQISFSKKKYNESIHEVLIHYYDLKEALSKEYILAPVLSFIIKDIIDHFVKIKSSDEEIRLEKKKEFKAIFNSWGTFFDKSFAETKKKNSNEEEEDYLLDDSYDTSDSFIDDDDETDYIDDEYDI